MIRIPSTGEWINENRFDKFTVEGASDSWHINAYKFGYEGDVATTIDKGYPTQSIAQSALDVMIARRK